MRRVFLRMQSSCRPGPVYLSETSLTPDWFSGRTFTVLILNSVGPQEAVTGAIIETVTRPHQDSRLLLVCYQSDRISPRTVERRVDSGRVSINPREAMSLLDLVTDRSP